MFQLDESAELQAILDGVFKAPKREERRARQRYSRRGLMHHPLSLSYTGEIVEGGSSPVAQTGFQTESQGKASSGAGGSPANGSVSLATTEDLIRSGYAEGRVINPPPPAAVPETGAAADLYGLGYIPPAARIWTDSK